jgi:hypothetical protein
MRIPISRNWLLALTLAFSAFLWQRTAIPAYMADHFPNQLGAYYWKHGEPEKMYDATSGRFKAWLAYSQPIADKLGLQGDFGAFMYPPFVAALLSPFADVQSVWWRDVVFVLNTLQMLVFAWQCLQACALRFDWRSYLWALALVLACYPVSRAVKLGQIVPLLAALTWVALFKLREGREWQGGILLGVMTAVKLFPGALVLLLVLDRRWRALAITLGTIAAIYALSILTLGWYLHSAWWTLMREFSDFVNPYFGNQSLMAWASRAILGHISTDETPFVHPLFEWLRLILPVIFGGGSIAAMWKYRGELTRGKLAWAAGLILSAVMLSVTTAWEHYWLFILPTLAWAFYEAWTQGEERAWRIWLYAAAFFFLTKLTHFIYEDTLIAKIISGSHTLGLLMLWIWSVRRAFRRPVSQMKTVVAAART